MSTELKEKIEDDFSKSNKVVKSLFQIIINSLNGIKWYAKDGKSFIIYSRISNRNHTRIFI